MQVTKYCTKFTFLLCPRLVLLLTWDGTKYSRMNQVRFVEDSLSKFEEIWSAVSRSYPSNFLKAVSYTFYLVHCWILCIKWLFSYARLRRSLASVYHWVNKNPMLPVINNNLLNSIHYSYAIDVIFLNFFCLILPYISVFQCAWNHWGS